MTIDQAISEAAALLPGVDETEKRRTARLLLGHVLGVDRAGLIVRAHDSIQIDQHDQYFVLVSRRVSGEPLQYITGHQEFFGLDFVVNPAVLIPRPETEFLVEEVLALAGRVGRNACAQTGESTAPSAFGSPETVADRGKNLTIIDIGTGSGCIAVALATRIADARIIATDLSGEALDTASLNAEKNRVGDRIEFVEGDLCDPLASLGLERSVDVIACNPPYVGMIDAPGLQKEVRDHEPATALYGGAQGLSFYGRLLAQAPSYLKPGGYLVCEIGYGQSDVIAVMAGSNDLELVKTTPDLQGIPRILTMRKKG
ncbi:MAG TPA: peptide chain release factor N(5)-glutamine methyltransferase [Blastocatellia bacterium]